MAAMAARGYAPWTASEEEQLKREHDAGISFERMCANHQRTEGAIRAHLGRVQPWRKASAAATSACAVARRGARWSGEEEQLLIRAHREGVALSEMAAMHGRTEGAIIARLCQVQPWTFASYKTRAQEAHTPSTEEARRPPTREQNASRAQAARARAEDVDSVIRAARGLDTAKQTGLGRGPPLGDIANMLATVGAASDAQWERAQRRMAADDDSSDDDLESILGRLALEDRARARPTSAARQPSEADQAMLRRLARGLDGQPPAWQELCDSGVSLRDGELLNTASLMAGGRSTLSVEQVVGSVKRLRARAAERAARL